MKEIWGAYFKTMFTIIGFLAYGAFWFIFLLTILNIMAWIMN
ncbi:hypothetical protein [Bacillus phage vB_BanS-Thrax5]|nr:hypothetical protein [Bacillus phage vB_BanS-Thrax5]